MRERWGQTCEIVIPLPPLAEHERNVAKLEKLMKFCDELEANIKQGITNAESLRQTALREALEPGSNTSSKPSSTEPSAGNVKCLLFRGLFSRGGFSNAWPFTFPRKFDFDGFLVRRRRNEGHRLQQDRRITRASSYIR